RILSVVMWYHFAFFAISVALFGLAASGMAVYLLPRLFTKERALTSCFAAAAAFAVMTPLTFLALAGNPAYRGFTSGAVGGGGAGGVGGGGSAGAFLQVAALSLPGVLPFLAGGLVGAVLFRHYGQTAGRLYFYDLIGAGLGCLATVPLLDWVGGPGAMVAVS